MVVLAKADTLLARNEVTNFHCFSEVFLHKAFMHLAGLAAGLSGSPLKASLVVKLMHFFCIFLYFSDWQPRKSYSHLILLPEKTIGSQFPLILLPLVLLAAVVPQRSCPEHGLSRLFIELVLISVLPTWETGGANYRDDKVGHGARVGKELRGEFLVVDSNFIEKLLICKRERRDAHGKSVVSLLLQHSQTKFVLHLAHYNIITACKRMY